MILLTLYSSPIEYNSNMVDLLMETMAVESDLGKYNKQLHGNIALGVYQMEPRTLQCIKDNYIKYNPELIPYLIGNLFDKEYATIMCVIHYQRYIRVIDIPDTREGRWLVYKKYYNTYFGKTNKKSYMAKAYKYLGEE